MCWNSLKIYPQKFQGTLMASFNGHSTFTMFITGLDVSRNMQDSSMAKNLKSSFAMNYLIFDDNFN